VLCAGLQFNPQYKCTGACAQQVYDKMFKTAAGALAAALAWPCLQGTCAGLLCLDCSGRVLSMSFQGPLLLLNQLKQLRLCSPVVLCLTSSHFSRQHLILLWWPRVAGHGVMRGGRAPLCGRAGSAITACMGTVPGYWFTVALVAMGASLTPRACCSEMRCQRRVAGKDDMAV